MATKKNKNYSKKKSAIKKKTSVKKTTTSTSKRVSSPKKKASTSSTTKVSSPKKNTPTLKKKVVSSKTATIKKPTTKKKNKKTSVVKRVEITKPIKITSVQDLEIEKKVELPKLKGQTKEVSKNTNESQRVIKTEEFTIIKKEPIRLKKEIKTPVNVKKAKSKAGIINKTKKSSFKKGLNKIKRKIKIYGLSSVFPIKYIILILFIISLAIGFPYIYRFITNQPIILNIEAIPDKIDHLEIVSFNINDVDDIVDKSEELKNLTSYYEYHFEIVFHLNPSYIKEYSLKYNSSSKQLLFVLKATDNNQENVKNVFDNFLNENKINNYEYMEYQGYQIYINTNDEANNAKIKSKIMQSKKEVFSYLKTLSKDEIDQTFKIAPSLYKEELVKTAMIIKSDTCQYVIFKPVDKDAKEEIKTRMNEYYESLEIKWANNLDNMNLVKNRLYEEYQGYLVYIISYDNNLVMDLIKSNK